MSILCRVGLHKWKIVQRYVPGGFIASVWPGVTGRMYHEYKGERCKRCGTWRKEGQLYCRQWFGLAMFILPIASLIVWDGGWALLGMLVGILLVGLLTMGGLFLAIFGRD